MKAETAGKILSIIDDALTAIYNIRDAEESEDVKFQIGEITNVLTQADVKALDEYLKARRE